MIPVLPITAPAKATPTAIPSGILWIVTASSIMVVFENPLFTPSGLSLARCRWGVSVSISSKNTIPSKNPTSAGTHGITPCSAAISMDGIKSDQTDAAIITPAANPSNAFSSRAFISLRIRNTIAAPSVVPSSGTSNTIISDIPISLLIYSYLITKEKEWCLFSYAMSNTLLHCRFTGVPSMISTVYSPASISK